MDVEKKIDMIIDMVANMNETMTEKFSQIDEKFERLENRLANVEGSVDSLRIENAQQHDLLRGKIGAVAEALNASNAMHDARYAELEVKCEELKAKDAALEQVQEQHSIDIMTLRAAM